MTVSGFSRTGLTYFAININLSLALQTVVTLLHNSLTRHAEELVTKHCKSQIEYIRLANEI